MPKMTIAQDIIDTIASVNAFQIFLVLSMLVCWTVVYLTIIIRNHKDKLAVMPWLALSMNISWEFVYTFVIPYPDPKYRLGILFWVLLDGVMFVQTLKYSKEDYNKILPGMEKYYYPVMIGVFLAFFAAVFSTNYQWTTLPDPAGHSAYIMNLMMSFLFITQIFRRPDTIKGISIWVAICKFWGSLAPTILGMIYLPGYYPFPYTLGIITAILDVIYIVLVYKHFKKLGYNPWNRKQIAA
ncbi:MAG: hypothetical protein IKX52_03575 [Clostridia bacterium]|nr:hypothetical protein [Clostridia bacterium]